MRIETGQVAAEFDALTSGNDLLNGSISYIGILDLSTKMNGSSAEVTLDTRQEGGWFLDPSSWGSFDHDDRWQIGLSPHVPLDLTFDTASGSVDMDLQGLDLQALEVDSGSGSVKAILPDGVYDVNIDTGSGASSWTLSPNVSGAYTIDSGSGSVRLLIPNGVEVRLDVDTGSGAFSADDRFTLIDGDCDEGIWQTTGYDTASQRLDIEIDSGSGSVTVAESELGQGR